MSQGSTQQVAGARLAESAALPSFHAIWAWLQPIVEKSAAIIVFLLAWEFAPRLGLINRTFLPPFSEVIVRGIQFAFEGKLLPQILVSLERALGGFSLGVITAVPLGILLGWYRPLER